MGRIERQKREVSVFKHKNKRDGKADEKYLQHVGNGDAQQVAKEDVRKVDLAGYLGYQDGAESKKRCEDDAYGCIGFDNLALLDLSDQYDRNKCKDQSTHQVRQPQKMRNDYAGKDGVRNGVSHQRPSHMRNPATQKAAYECGGKARYQSALHERVFEDFDLRHGAPPRYVRVR